MTERGRSNIGRDYPLSPNAAVANADQHYFVKLDGTRIHPAFVHRASGICRHPMAYLEVTRRHSLTEAVESPALLEGHRKNGAIGATGGMGRAHATVPTFSTISPQ